VKAEALNAEHGTILVVDDDSATRRALHMTLSGMGFTVVEAARGEEALSLVRVTRLDAVLLDVDMPGMGGMEACRAIRHAVARLPILMLTVMDSEDDKVLALDAGADDYITKPRCAGEMRRIQTATGPFGSAKSSSIP
jgi:two-component system KDP operon response regulator KdpE